MRVNPGVEFSKRKQMQAQPPRTICGKENCAPTPSSAGSVALLGVRRSPGTPGLRRRMLKDDLLELLNGDAVVAYHGSMNGDVFAVADVPNQDAVARLSTTEGITVTGLQRRNGRISNGPWYVRSGLR